MGHSQLVHDRAADFRAEVQIGLLELNFSLFFAVCTGAHDRVLKQREQRLQLLLRAAFKQVLIHVEDVLLRNVAELNATDAEREEGGKTAGCKLLDVPEHRE